MMPDPPGTVFNDDRLIEIAGGFLCDQARKASTGPPRG
jgi:hypothetical protein